MPPWITLWTRSLEIAFGAPEVIARRLQMMYAPSPWTLETWLESQRMVWEKGFAAWRAWTTLWFGVWPRSLPRWDQPLASGKWSQRWHEDTARTWHQALKPYSTTVRANARRLRKK
ncbi:MAG TPA: hypothetical protein VNO84_03590 [Burkholderiaceae bacterium]|nr:hypothetical protein [Burkholderiaceae bacterium]